jgi:DNA polymerase-3 subunit chi
MAEPCEVWFYHLQRSGPEQVLPDILSRCVGRKWRVVVLSPDAERLERLDEHLWTFNNEAFLPHGMSGSTLDVRQPILLAQGEAPVQGRDVLILLDGARPATLEGLKRCIIMFDGLDQQQLASAREFWRWASGNKFPASYWKQTESGWEKQA